MSHLRVDEWTWSVSRSAGRVLKRETSERRRSLSRSRGNPGIPGRFESTSTKVGQEPQGGWCCRRQRRRKYRVFRDRYSSGDIRGEPATRVRREGRESLGEEAWTPVPCSTRKGGTSAGESSTLKPQERSGFASSLCKKVRAVRGIRATRRVVGAGSRREGSKPCGWTVLEGGTSGTRRDRKVRRTRAPVAVER